MSLYLSNWANIILLATSAELSAAGLNCNEEARRITDGSPLNEWGEPEIVAICVPPPDRIPTLCIDDHCATDDSLHGSTRHTRRGSGAGGDS